MCSINGIFGHSDAVYLTYLGGWALQHRGSGESCGMVAHDGKNLTSRIKEGNVAQSYREISKLDDTVGHTAMFQNRYSTAGEKFNAALDMQPIIINHDGHTISIAHNGHLYNGQLLRRKLERQGAIFKTSSDTEVILHLALRSVQDTIEDKLVDALQNVRGSYSLLVMYDDKLIAARDPHGYRPLAMGTKDDAVAFASETCAFDLMGVKYEREVKRGELVSVNHNGIISKEISYGQDAYNCIFEYIYFARPDSKIFGVDVEVMEVRKRFGRQLAKEAGWSPDFADVVIGIPDSGLGGALGIHEESTIPYDQAMLRNHAAGRTFLKPKQGERDIGVKMKLSAIKSSLAGKRVLASDDSLMRGTTSRRNVRMIRDAGATEVHMAIVSAPNVAPCFWGTDTPTKDELIASKKSPEEIRGVIEADSLTYISHDGMVGCVPESCGLCTRCMTGVYPDDLVDLIDRKELNI